MADDWWILTLCNLYCIIVNYSAVHWLLWRCHRNVQPLEVPCDDDDDFIFLCRAATELRNEVAVHSKLKHENIVILMGVVFEQGNYGIVLEYATYGDLWHFIRRFSQVCAVVSKRHLNNQLISANPSSLQSFRSSSPWLVMFIFFHPGWIAVVTVATAVSAQYCCNALESPSSQAGMSKPSRGNVYANKRYCIHSHFGARTVIKSTSSRSHAGWIRTIKQVGCGCCLNIMKYFFRCF